MARLNEPAAPIETIESLKRKFMRQNRDIARANSTQSLRIRTLENETSRLLAENLGLREEILRLQNEVENGRAQRFVDKTGLVKTQLEAKMLEIRTLISSLGDEPTPRKKSPRTGRLIRASPRKSPDQTTWRNICTSSEGQDGKLPPILENKSYPRRTLENQDIIKIMAEAAADTTDSPEIGPPPISQFVEDPVKIDLPSRTRTDDDEGLTSLDPAMSINLEQRKKRKDIVGGGESRKARVETAQPILETTGALKVGAKRKLSVRDDAEPEPGTKSAEDHGDFKFTRGVSDDRSRGKPAPQPEKVGARPPREIAAIRGAAREKPTSTVLTTRKVLAPKSVNSSPRKSAKGPLLDDIKATKANAPRGGLTRERVQEPKPEPVLDQRQEAPITETAEIPLEPETPADLDMFSPLLSQPSTARAESRDTPPPPELGPGTEGQRPSRRARAAVSYAEPSLRDKMRRPTKDLADAVGAEMKRNSTVKLEEDGSSITVQIKPEPEADDAWKNMPVASARTVENSPLSRKVAVPDSLPSNITTHRKRRESILLGTEPEPPRSPRSNAGNAIAALLASSRKAKLDSKEKTNVDENEQPKSTDEADIYEFRGSSPAPPSVEEVPAKAGKEEKPISRFSRRNSSMAKNFAPTDDSEASDMEAPKRPESLVSRRRVSTLGLRTTSASSASTVSLKGDDGEKSTRSNNVSADHGSRGDRIAARRRSMMT